MLGDNIDTLISSIVKNSDEIEAENRHGWKHLSPPSCCFNNCFKKTDALDESNWINIYPDYYWTMNKYNLLKKKIEDKLYRDEGEHEYWLKLLQKYIQYINQIQRPINFKPLSIAPPAASIPAAIPGCPNAVAIPCPAA